MSGADEDEEAGPPGLPAGTPFYMTPAGAAALRAEVKRLWEEERPKVVDIVSWAAALGDRSENADYQYGKRRLREIDRRVRFLTKRLEKVQVVDPAQQTRRDQVFFGATVTYARASDDVEVTITIVGVDEAEAEAGRASLLILILVGHGVKSASWAASQLARSGAQISPPLVRCGP